MRLGPPVAAASAVAAMTGASLIASPVLANSSNSNSSSTPSSTAEATTPPGSPAQPTPTPGKTGETTPAPGKTSAGSSFKITQEKTFASSSTNTSFTVSGTGCTGKQATVGIALYAPDGSVSDVVKTEAAADGSWTSDLDLAALIKSIGSTTATTTDGWTIGAGCMTYGDKTETAQVTKQQQTQIYFDDTRISGSYEVSTRTESQSQTFIFNAQGFYASEKVTVLLKSKSDSSICYTLGELTVDANGNLTGNLPAPTDAPDGEYVLVLTGSHHSETATSQTVTTVSQHTFTVESTERSTTETETAEKYSVRRYGAHGTSHQFVSQEIAKLEGRDDLKQIVLHLGNGASVSAVKNGKPIDTSMGLTPLEGLVMGGRTGDIDPAAVFHLARVAGMSIDEIDHLFNRGSGMKGLAGDNDMREVWKRIGAGEQEAREAMDIYLHRLVKYVGAYTAVMGGLDALTFTAGIGENDANLRRELGERLGFMGVTIDQEVNETRSDEPRVISTPDSKVTVLVVPTNEELAIARQALTLI